VLIAASGCVDESTLLRAAGFECTMRASREASQRLLASVTTGVAAGAIPASRSAAAELSPF